MFIRINTVDNQSCPKPNECICGKGNFLTDLYIPDEYVFVIEKRQNFQFSDM